MKSIARQPDYSDLNLDFLAHPTTGDVARLTGNEAIKRSVRNLILTNFYDRPFRSYLGSNAQKLLYENINPLTASFLKDAIEEVLTNYEPRIKILDIKINVSPDNNGYDVTLQYMIVSKSIKVAINIFLTQIR